MQKEHMEPIRLCDMEYNLQPQSYAELTHRVRGKG